MSDWTPLKWLGDGVSATAIVGAIIGALPAIAALVGVIYYLIQIYESSTFQKRLASWKVKHHRHQIGVLMKRREQVNAKLTELGPVRDAE